MNRLLAVLVALLVATPACSPRAPRTTPSRALPPVDHIQVGIDSLERGIAMLRELTGVAPAVGGVHPGRGTRNALLSLGDATYLELIAPNPADTSSAARGPAGDLSRRLRMFHSLTPIGWAVRSRDAFAARARFVEAGLPAGAVEPGSRRREDGRMLRWRTFDPWGAERDVLPFFIEWAASSPHPSSDAPAGCRLATFAVESPAADSLRRDFSRAALDVDVRAAATERLTIALDCPAGRVRLP